MSHTLTQLLQLGIPNDFEAKQLLQLGIPNDFEAKDHLKNNLL